MNIETFAKSDQQSDVSITGRLDALEAPELRKVLEGLLSNGSRQFIIDLTNVDFVDSAGLAALVKTMKDARSLGGDVALVKPLNKNAMRVFELTRFDKVFEMLDANPSKPQQIDSPKIGNQ